VAPACAIQIRCSNSHRSDLANAPLPLFFERPGVSLQSSALRTSPRGWSAERRLEQSTPCGAGARIAGRAPLSAPSRRLCTPGPCFRDSDGGLVARPIPWLSPRSSCRVQPIEGQTPLVGSDGYPRRPGGEVTSPACRRRSDPAEMTSHDNALGWIERAKCKAALASGDKFCDSSGDSTKAA
jgi:hypothetical protein